MIETFLRDADERRARGDLPGAVDACRRAIASEPRNPRGYSHLAHTALQSYDYTTAREAFADVVRVAPSDPGHRNNFGMMLIYIGDFEAAREQFLQAIAIDRAFVPAYYNLASFNLTTQTTEFVRTLESMKNGGTRSDLDQSMIGFTLGKLYHELGEWDLAFKNYADGNKKKNARYDHTSTLAFLAETKSVFSAAPTTRRADQKAKRPIFIVGMPRCGSSLVEELLARQEGVVGLGERNEIPNIVSIIGQRHRSALGYPRCVPHLIAEELDELADRYFVSVDRQAANASTIIDKQLLNFQYVPLIRMIFPTAAIVHCARNPIDTCLSAYFTNFQTGFSYSFDQAQLALYFRAYHDLMEHWRSIMPDDLVTLQYEDLVGDRRGVIERLQDQLGIPHAAADGADQPAVRDIRTSSAWQVRQPVYTHAVARWRNYEKHLGPLIQSLGDLAE